MSVCFNNYNISLDLPEGTTLFNKEQLIEKVKNKEGSENCIMLGAEPKTHSMFSLTFITEIKNDKEYFNLINDFVKLNQRVNVEVVNRNTLVSEDKRVLDCLIIKSSNFTNIIIFAKVGNRVFEYNMQCNVEDYKDLLNFSVKTMTTIR